MCAIFVSPKITYDYPPGPVLPAHELHVATSTQTHVILHFVGDIMLARGVEQKIDAHGKSYPFAHLPTLTKGSDFLVGNFEGVVTEVPYPTPSMTMRFSIREEYLHELALQGFDVLSLANNHSYDYGDEAFLYTRAVCADVGIMCIGTPYTPHTLSDTILEKDGIRVGIIALHTLYVAQDTEELRERLGYLQGHSDVQIAYVHWGDEYQLVHGVAQEKLAVMLIKHGIDVVIGHHPHVVQDVAFYDGKPIFYSLGNFIFDQYFSESVMEGLLLEMHIESDLIRYKLVPIESATAHAQPRRMSKEAGERLLSRILSGATSTKGVRAIDTTGEIVVER